MGAIVMLKHKIGNCFLCMVATFVNWGAPYHNNGMVPLGEYKNNVLTKLADQQTNIMMSKNYKHKKGNMITAISFTFVKYPSR